MILKQFYLKCLAHASYLIGAEETHGRCRRVSARRSQPSAWRLRRMSGRRSWSTCGHRANASRNVSPGVGVPLTHLGERVSELPADRPLLVYCARGYRSSIAASLLQRHGFTQVSESRRALRHGTQGSCLWKPSEAPPQTVEHAGPRWCAVSALPRSAARRGAKRLERPLAKT
jgi:rhodanese-related sulfurtransferase